MLSIPIPIPGRKPLVSRWPKLALALAFGLAFLICNGSAAAASTTDVVVVSVKGDVQVTMRGTARAVRAGGIVELPASVRTGADGAIEFQQGPTTVSVAANTQIEIPAAGLGEPIDRVIQPQGSAFYNVGKRLGKKLRVETPYLVAVIKGTQFNVAVQGDGTTVSLFEGQLEVRAPDDSDVVNINAGEIAIRHATDKTIRVLRMDKTAPPAKPGDGNDRSGNGLTSGQARNPGEDPAATPSPTDRAADDSNTSRPSGPSVPGLNDVSAATPELDASINLSTRGEGDADAAAALQAGPAALGASVDVDLGGGAAVMSVDAGLGTGALNAGVGVDAAADLGSGSIAAGAAAALDLGGAVSADVGVDAGVDLGAGTVNTSAGVGVDAGAVNAGVTVGVALDAASGAATVDLGAAAGPIDASVGASIDAGSPAATVDVAATVAPVDVSAGTSVDVGTGTTSVDVGVGGLDLGVAVDLGAGSIDVGLGTATDTSTAPGTTTDNGGLLGGLSGLLGKHR